MPSSNPADITADFQTLMDKEVRRQIVADPKQYALDNGMNVEDKEVVVAKCTKEVFYLPIERAPESELSSADLGRVSAGVNIGSASTSGTVGCICGTVSSLGSAGTAAP